MTSPTLADVAREVGVSRTTVSNAYNRPDQLSPVLRSRILEPPSASGTRVPTPSPAACAAAHRHGRPRGRQPLSYLFTDPAIRQFLIGMTMVLDEAEASLALLPRIIVDDAGAHVLANAAVDGFVSVCDTINAERVQALMVRHLPFVVVDGVASAAACRVSIDDHGASRAWSSTCWRSATTGSVWQRCHGSPATAAARSIPTSRARCASRSRPPAWPASASASRPPGRRGRTFRCGPCPTTSRPGSPPTRSGRRCSTCPSPPRASCASATRWRPACSTPR